MFLKLIFKLTVDLCKGTLKHVDLFFLARFGAQIIFLFQEVNIGGTKMHEGRQ